MSKWNVFSNHGHVLLYLSRSPDARLRDVAAAVGITERAVQKIVRDMQDSGVVNVTKRGRRNRYAIDGSAPLRHELEAHCSVGRVVDLIADGAAGDAEREAASAPVRPAPEPPKAVPKPEKPTPKPVRKARKKKAPEPKAPATDKGEQGSLF